MDAIYLKDGDDFVAMDEQPYDAEVLLQRLLAEHPALLAGGHGEGEANWLLIEREAGISDSAEGSNRWSLDHLFVDRDGVPTLVEVKRSSDTRGRREVVAQMLDYAANSTAHWSVDHLRERFEARVGEDEAAEQVARLLGDDEVTDEAIGDFWARVATNLGARRLRLVFVADVVPHELRRIVEFLNEQMEQTDVLALEVKQFIERGGSRTTLVPRLIGDTSRAQATKGRTSTPRSEGTRHAARRRFWAALLDAMPANHPHKSRSDSPDNWLDGKSGVRGLAFKYRVRRDEADISVLLQSPDASLNEARFDALLAQRREIESQFGGALTWNRKSGSKKCEILATEWPRGLDDESDWPTLHADMIETMGRLMDAFKPALAQL